MIKKIVNYIANSSINIWIVLKTTPKNIASCKILRLLMGFQSQEDNSNLNLCWYFYLCLFSIHLAIVTYSYPKIYCSLPKDVFSHFSVVKKIQWVIRFCEKQNHILTNFFSFGSEPRLIWLVYFPKVEIQL